MKLKRRCVECGRKVTVKAKKPGKVANPVYRCMACKEARAKRMAAKVKAQRAELRRVISTLTIAEIASPFFADRVCGK